MPQLVYVINKLGHNVTLSPNAIQRKLASMLGNKTLVLKARQMGLSTFVLGMFFLECILPRHTDGKSNITAAIYSYKDVATQLLLDKVDLMYKSLPNPKPAMERDSVFMKTFPEMGSKLYIGTAGARVEGLGDTIHRIHFSEFSYWEDNKAKKMRGNVEQSMPLDGIMIVENTANGEGGDFYELWNDPTSTYRNVFLPWFYHEEYLLREDDPQLSKINYFITHPEEAKHLEFTPEEVALVSQHHLDDPQARIRWRRMKIAETKDLFPQWYPEDPVSCFISSGTSIFDKRAISYLSAQCVPAPIESEDRMVRQWQLPRMEEKYIIGADAADPDPHNLAKGDWCAAVVLSSRLDHVATLRGKFDPADFAKRLANLARLYGDATLVVERNNPGAAVLVALEGIEKYPYLYRTGGKSGYITTSASKIRVVMGIKDIVNSLSLNTRDEMLMRELRTYRRDEDGRYNAKQGSSDDLVMALGVAVQGFGEDLFRTGTARPQKVMEKYGWASKGW